MYIVFFGLCLCLCLWQRIWVESGIKTILGYSHTLLLASFLEAHPPFAENLAQLYFKCFFKYNIWRSFTVGTFVFHCQAINPLLLAALFLLGNLYFLTVLTSQQRKVKWGQMSHWVGECPTYRTSATRGRNTGRMGKKGSETQDCCWENYAVG